MKAVDFAKLSEQYASFLVAVGGVSITVLALVLSLASPPTEFIRKGLGEFLILALIVATACCFIGAHMMAETAAFISRAKAKLTKDNPRSLIPPAGTSLGERLFLLASINIFIAVGLVLFALMLLPWASTLPGVDGAKRISFVVFLFVISGALFWMYLAANYRMSVVERRRAIIEAICIGLLWASFLSGVYLLEFERLLLWLTFIPITAATVGSLAYFAWSFKHSSEACSRKVGFWDILFFGSAITVSYASLVVAGIRTMF